MSDVPLNGNGFFTQKEMLVRIDSKVDSLTQTVAVKNAYYDVEVALLKARADKLENASKELDEALDEARDRQESILTRINVAAGAVAIIVFLSPILWILANKYIGT